LCAQVRANQCPVKANRNHHVADCWLDDYFYGRDDLLCGVDIEMKDWAVSFIAAALFCGLVVWCAKVVVEVLYVG
jgi:hypothetical protein